ncbi:hypothetical protein FSP39_022176 [Pinctada imbricata]|uniref:Tripartite motif-containing protein 2 n=1 Tax=Pinctada imbricata TaxID=66713 RepID=A0AA89CCX5_PINIB|nr:hypothetical protein FSP39_022176 [Pinctada imbricata]
MAESKTFSEQKSLNTCTYYEDIEVDVKYEKEFNVGDSRTSTICLISETEAWVRSDKLNKLVNDSGNMKRSLDSKCLLFHFAVSENGITYFCDPDDKDVIQIDKKGEIGALFSVTPLIPSYINLTRSGDLLITLEDEDSYVRNSSSRRLVRRTSMTGEALMEYEYDSDGKTPLFCRPMRPIEHVNGNICVINQYEQEPDIYSGTIYGFDSRGKINFKYSGIDGDFNPVDICCDTVGNIFISDCINKQIHIIDLKGRFVCFLTLEPFKERLLAISMYDSKLWVGSYDSGLIKVFQFKLSRKNYVLNRNDN